MPMEKDLKDKHPSETLNPLSGVSEAGLSEARQRTVRLIISIPVLTLLIVLMSGVILFSYLQYAEKASISQEVKSFLESEEQRDPRFAEAVFQIEVVQNRFEAIAQISLLLSIFLSILAALVGYVLARQIVKPIKNLADTMDTIARGDLSIKLQPVQLGEFGQLGSTFNRMVEQLNSLFEERDRQLRESIKGAHLIVDRQGTIKHADVISNRILGLTVDQLIGKNLLLISSKIPVISKNPALADAISKTISSTRSGSSSSRSVTVSGLEGSDYRRYHLVGVALEADSRQHDEILLEIRDITSMAGFYEQIQRADRLAAVGTLATGIAHEIRNPIASVRGMAQLLAEDVQNNNPDNPDTSIHDRIIKELDRLEKLISGIMTFAQPVETHVEEIDINSLLQEVDSAARASVGAEADEIRVSWELDSNLPKACLQGEKLRQALLNLLLNAYQAVVSTSRKAIEIRTSCYDTERQRPLEITLSNPGQPLSEEQMERIFEPFYTTKAEGTGLGLPIAYHTILSNNGTLEVFYENGMITFRVSLPLESKRSASGTLSETDLRGIMNKV